MQGFGYAPAVTLTTMVRYCLFQGLAIILVLKVNNHLATLPLFQTGCYGYLVRIACCYAHLANMSLFQEVVRTNLFCLGSTPGTLLILTTKSSIWKSPTPERHKHISSHPILTSSTHLRERQTMYIKKRNNKNNLVLINLAMMFWVDCLK